MSIEYAALPKAAILIITYPDYAGHLKRTKAHNDGQRKSERNKQQAIECKLKQKKDAPGTVDQKVEPRLRLSLIDGSIELDSSLKPITLKDLKQLLPRNGVIFENKSVKPTQDSNIPDPLGL